jgi:nucleotide-binding universal stress UspA family protein
VKAGIRFAKEIGAKVVGYYAVEPVQAYYYSEGAMIDGRLIAELDRQSTAAGEKTLAAMAKLAKASRVRLDSRCDKPSTPTTASSRRRAGRNAT